jgi:hypothetical protein
MKKQHVFRAAGLLGLLALAAIGPVSAGLDVDFGAAVRLDDSTDLYFRMSSRYFDQDRATVTRWAGYYHDPDDLAVALFLHRHSGRSLDELYALRHQRGLTWWEIGVRFGVPVDVWYVPVGHDPGPPYGKAYGYWKKHGRNRARTVVLSDAECRDLVALRVAHEYFGVPVDVAVAWRSEGNLRDVMSAEYRKRHGGRQGAAASAAGHDTSAGHTGSPGRGKGKKKK